MERFKTEPAEYTDATRGQIPEEEQECIVREVERQEKNIETLASRVNPTDKSRTVRYSTKFFVFFLLIADVLGLTKNALYEYLELPRNAILRRFLASETRNNELPVRSWLYKQLNRVEAAVGGEILYLAWMIKRAVNDEMFHRYLNTTRGLQSRSAERFTIDTVELLRLIDFTKYMPWGTLKIGAAFMYEKMLRATVYLYLVPLASFNELIGRLKTVSIISAEAVRLLSAKLGFYGGPPGKTRLNEFFKQLDIKILHAIWRDLLLILIEKRLVDTFVVSLDSTSIAAQENDPDKKEGVSSRGPFDGFKLHLGVSNGGIPIFAEVTTGEKADGNYVSSFCKTLVRLRRRFPWLKIEFADLDAAYDWVDNIRELEALPDDTVPVIDINPGKSRRLKALKEKGDRLAVLSKKALKEGGLEGTDREAYEALHAEVVDAIETIEREGTPTELAKAFNGMVYASITWFLVYHRRAVVEGVFGIMKKLLGLLDRRQKQTRFKSLEKIRKHCLLVVITMNLRALGNYFFTDRTVHLLESPHNWPIAGVAA